MEIFISSFISSKFFGTLYIKTCSLWLTFESVKALEIKTFRLSNLDFTNDDILPCFFFLIIDLYFLISAEIETHPKNVDPLTY